MKPLLFFRAENSVDAEKTLREEAGHWVVRRDRGFSQAEALEFERWLRAAPGHAAAIERSTLAWRMLDEISHPVIAKSARSHTRSTLFWPLAATGLAAAAALVIGYTGWWQSTNRTDSGRVDPVRSIAVQRTPAHLNTFSDGTIVHLNASSDVIEQFTPAERRVLLAYGEAYFSVAKNPARPFIVRARQVEVRAIGTMFDVNLQASAIEVLVTEGQVRVTSNGSTGEYVVVQAGQRATVALGTGAVRGITVASISEADEAAALTWQGSLLKLGGATLAELALEFRQRTGHRLLMGEPSLGEMRIGGRFRADDIDGFVRVLEENYGLQAERRGPDETVLHQRK